MGHYCTVERKYFHDRSRSQKNVSVSSVYRVLKRFYQPMNPFKANLPTVLHFDEFKSVRQVSGAISFIILNCQTRTLFDIVEKQQGKYWKLLQKNQEKLDSLNRRWHPSFKTYLTEIELVDRQLSYNVELTQDYTLYQDFLYAIYKRNQTYFDALHAKYFSLVRYLSNNYKNF